ncbi:hypothetical protein ACFLQN_04350 [Candidatus Aenigmatarchaeota archaeon]
MSHIYALIVIISLSFFCVAHIITILKNKYNKTWKKIGSPGLFKVGKISPHKFEKMLMWDKKIIPKDKQINFYRNIIRICGFLDIILFASFIINVLFLFT